MRNKVREIIFIIIFFIAIIIPMIMLNNKTFDDKEKRELVKLPSFIINKGVNYNFSKDFDSWFNDHYGLRENFISINSNIHLNIFKDSPNYNVITGKNNWLFYGKENSVEYFQGKNLYSVEQLHHIAYVLNNRQKDLKQKGIDFVIILSPNKETIYNEYYKSGIHNISGITKTDQFVDFMKNHSTIKVIDLRETLLQSKGKDDLYYKTDSHWNQYGAFFGAKKIISEIKKIGYNNINDLDLNDYNIVNKDKITQGDLLNIIGATKYKEYNEIEFSNKNRDGFKYIKTNEFDFKTENENKELPTAVMFRDSFATNLVPFMSRSFKEIRYNWMFRNRFDMKIIEEEKPNLVIIEAVERYIDQLYFD